MSGKFILQSDTDRQMNLYRSYLGEYSFKQLFFHIPSIIEEVLVVAKYLR